MKLPMLFDFLIGYTLGCCVLLVLPRSMKQSLKVFLLLGANFFLFKGLLSLSARFGWNMGMFVGMGSMGFILGGLICIVNTKDQMCSRRKLWFRLAIGLVGTLLVFIVLTMLIKMIFDLQGGVL